MSATMSIDPALFLEFLTKWDNKEFEGLRFGQAFYNTFSLHKVNACLDEIYEAKDPSTIFKYFELH